MSVSWAAFLKDMLHSVRKLRPKKKALRRRHSLGPSKGLLRKNWRQQDANGTFSSWVEGMGHRNPAEISALGNWRFPPLQALRSMRTMSFSQHRIWGFRSEPPPRLNSCLHSASPSYSSPPQWPSSCLVSLRPSSSTAQHGRMTLRAGRSFV